MTAAIAPLPLKPDMLGFQARPTPYGPAWQRQLRLPAPHPPQPEATAWAEALGATHPGPWLFLDLESTGRRVDAATYAFLVGLLVWQPGRPWRLYQWLLPHPAEEAALLTALAEIWPSGSPLLLTYNGQRFDLPLLESRALLNGLTEPPWMHPRHVDVLPWVRRVFRGAWPNHRLSTAAQRLLGQARPKDDLPGRLIPEVYHHALLTGEVAPLAPVLRHNQADLVALAGIWSALSRELSRLPPARRYPATTWLARGRLYHQYDDEQRAHRAWQRAYRRADTPETRARAGLALAQAYYRAGEEDAACALWQELAVEGIWEAYERCLRWYRRRGEYEAARDWLRRAQAHLQAPSTSRLDRALWQARFAAWQKRLQRDER